MDVRFFLCLFIFVLLFAGGGVVLGDFSFKQCKWYLPHEPPICNPVVLASRRLKNDDHWPCSSVLMMSWQGAVYLRGLWISSCPGEITLCSAVQQISTGTVMGRKVPIFLYPQGQEGNLQLPVSLHSTILAWKDKGIRPLAARLAKLRWWEWAVAHLRKDRKSVV